MKFQRNDNKYLGHHFEYYLTITDLFKMQEQATVHIISHMVTCFMYKNLFCIRLYGLGLADACVI